MRQEARRQSRGLSAEIAKAECGTSSARFHPPVAARSLVSPFSLLSAISQAVSLGGAIPLVCQDRTRRSGEAAAKWRRTNMGHGDKAAKMYSGMILINH